MNLVNSCKVLVGFTAAGSMSEKKALLQLVSQTSGILSVSLWLFAQIPQIIENYLNKSVDGVSGCFLSMWITGDVSNLMGCILTRAMPFQTCIAAYYCFIDVILTIEYWYYTRVYPYQGVHHNLLESPKFTRGLGDRVDAHDRSRTNRFEMEWNGSPVAIPSPGIKMKRRQGFFLNVLSASLLASSLTRQASAYPISWEGQEASQETTYWSTIVKGITKMISCSSPFEFLSEKNIGQVFAWFCSLLYVSSRLPQIHQNYSKRSTKGVSPYLFFFALLGNTFYAVSIITDLYLLYLQKVPGDTDGQFDQVFQSQIPFLVGSMGTVMFDIILLSQYSYYSSSAVSENEVGGTNIKSVGGKNVKIPATHSSDEMDTPNEATPFSFQKPKWYTNNHLEVFSDDERSYHSDMRDNVQKYRHDENAFSYDQIQNPMFTPPQHYVSAGTFNETLNTAAGIGSAISNKLNSIARSLSEGNSYMHSKSPISSSSMISSHFNQAYHGSPQATTALIPSIVENYSSIGRKMSHDAKVPFSPSDFLVGKLHRSTDSENIN